VSNDDPLVCMRHVRAAKFCVRGAKAWADRHNLDFRHFIQHGYPASVIEGAGDGLGKLIAEIARKEANEEVRDGSQ
jgi:hypothetical protein